MYREVKRKAAAGERIKIVNAGYAGEPPAYANGDILTAVRTMAIDAVQIDRNWRRGGRAWVYDNEYVVLEPIATPTPDLPDLFAQFIRDNASAVRSYLDGLDPDGCAEPTVNVPQPAPALTRAKVIEMARERVAELVRIGGALHGRLAEGSPFHDRFYRVEFHVNRDKRTVTALVRSGIMPSGKKPDAVGIAKCAPDDVFNADIGKAIAAERALGLTLTEAFVNAPKPEKALVGMIVMYDDTPRGLISIDEWPVTGKTAHVGSVVGLRGTIIDDTDADYTQEGGEAA